MEWAFDLWDYEDVKEHVEDILRHLEAGTMPCDAPWPPEQTEKFKLWIADGMPA